MVLLDFVLIGTSIIFIGAFLVFKALKAQPQEIESKKIGILFLGSIPLIISGSRKWIIMTLGIAGIIFIFMFAKDWIPAIVN